MDCRAEGEGSPIVIGSIEGEGCLLSSSLSPSTRGTSWKSVRWLSWTYGESSIEAKLRPLAVWRRQPLSACARLLPILSESSLTAHCSSASAPSVPLFHSFLSHDHCLSKVSFIAISWRCGQSTTVIATYMRSARAAEMNGGRGQMPTALYGRLLSAPFALSLPRAT
ncbi:hypothetical protein BV20DRAFT_695401 [Pilatotrama ljubarskyi]|nr:hypothetical protein BV20DRAFT_695401 [Pilatotrama ljubarskyi]